MNEISLDELVPKRFCILFWRYTRRLCKAESLYVQFVNNNFIYVVHLLKITDFFTLIGRSSPLYTFIQL